MCHESLTLNNAICHCQYRAAPELYLYLVLILINGYKEAFPQNSFSVQKLHCLYNNIVLQIFYHFHFQYRSIWFIKIQSRSIHLRHLILWSIGLLASWKQTSYFFKFLKLINNFFTIPVTYELCNSIYNGTFKPVLKKNLKYL